MAFAHIGLTNGDQAKQFKMCWEQVKTVSASDTATGTKGHDVTSASYLISASPLHLSVRTEFQGRATGYETATGSAEANVVWIDTLTPHSKIVPIVSPGSRITIPPTDVIHLTIQFRDSDHQCSGGNSSFRNFSVAVASAKFSTGLAIGTSNDSTSDDVDCGPLQASGVIEVLNGYPFQVSVGLVEMSMGNVGEQYAASGDAIARRADARFCIRRPQYPTDLDITSASGQRYWC
ncbi:MAG TPA: hypothetical protein VEJ20_06115 [Candidatus Eremiobacteraceae bacterium]|nr:hypothetical protein [Candidatus Eremiobacteraceae bacterium]